MSNKQRFGSKLAKYVNLHNPEQPGQKLPPHAVFNNALTLAEAVGEKPSVELFKHIDNEYLEEQQKEKTAMNLIQFGAKIASSADLHNEPTSEELVRRAKAVKDEAERTGRPVYKNLAAAQKKEKPVKRAASSCSPCDMPNGPANKKHMTGASPAVLEADESSEEIKPKTTETEHDKRVVSGKIARTTKKAVGPIAPPVRMSPAVNIQLPSVHEVAKQTALFGAPIGAVLGGAIGGFGSKKDKLKNTLLGALKGTAVGGAAGAGTVYGGRYLPELMYGATGAHAGVGAAVPAGALGGGLLAGGLTGAGFDALTGNTGEEEKDEQKKQARDFGAAVKRSFVLSELKPDTPTPISPYTADFLGGVPNIPRPSELELARANITNSVYPQKQQRPNIQPKREGILNYSGPRNTLDSVIDAYAGGTKSLVDTIGKGLYQFPSSLYNMAGLVGDLSNTAGGNAPSSYAYGMGPASASGQVKNTAKSPAAKPTPTPTPKPEAADMLSGLDARTALMYGLPIGLGGAGLYALYNYLNSKPKKKTEDEKKKTEDEKEKA